jgi:hypothetical protein
MCFYGHENARRHEKQRRKGREGAKSLRFSCLVEAMVFLQPLERKARPPREAAGLTEVEYVRD